MRVPTETLRRFYERTYDGIESPAAYEGTSLAEFLEIARKIHPRLTTRGARSLAPLALRQDVPDLEPASAAQVRRTQELSASEVDLGVARVDAGAQALAIKGCISSLPSLARWPSLETVSIVGCRAAGNPGLGPAVSIDTLEATDTTPEAAYSLSAAIAARNLIIDVGARVLDAHNIPTTKPLEELMLTGRRITGLASVAAASLRSLGVSAETLPKGIAHLLRWPATKIPARTLGALERLWISTVRPFTPSELFHLQLPPALSLVLVPSFPELRAQWIDFAVAHPEAGFVFSGIVRESRSTYLETYRGVELWKCREGGAVRFEFADDIVSRRRLGCDNADLLERLAPRLERTVGASADADEIIVQSKTLVASRRALDILLDAPLE